MLDRTGKRILLIAVPLLVLGGLLTILSPGEKGTPVDAVSPFALRRVKRHYEACVKPGFLFHGVDDVEERRALFGALRAEGRDGPRILVRLIRDDERPRFGLSSAPFWDDPRAEPLGIWLADNPDPRIDPDLLALARDRERHEEVRRTAVVALCRPGNEAAMVPLAELALDPTEPASYRRGILYRLPRIERSAPPRLRELLYVPFGALDRTAASALGACGDPEATSTILAALRHPPEWFHPEGDQVLAARAVVQLTGRGAEDLAWLEEGPTVSYSYNSRTSEAERQARERRAEEEAERAIRERLDRLAAVLDEWLTEDPSRTDTDYERDRRDYLASERRRRELDQTSWTIREIAELRDEPLDLAAAALVASPVRNPEPGRWLEELHRLALLVRRDLDGGETPEEVLAALARRLTPKRHVVTSWCPPGYESLLCRVLREGWGDDVGLSLLYLAVADRLDLPLFGVMAPGGMFVRYDDGRTRLNAVPDEFGAIRTDAEIAPDLPPDLLASGAYMRNLGRRQVLGVVLARSAALALDRGAHALAFEAANGAVRLRPLEALAWRVRALAGFELLSVPDEQLLDDLRHASELSPSAAAGRSAVATAYEELGRYREALVEWDRIAQASPRDLIPRSRRAVCRLRLGERERAFRELEEIEAEWPEAPELARLRLAFLAFTGDASWRDRLAEVEEPAELPLSHLEVARALLAETDDHEPDFAAALEVLEEIAPFAERSWGEVMSFKVQDAKPGDVEKEMARRVLLDAGSGMDASSYDDLRAGFFLLLARATHGTGDRDEALRLLDRAEEIGGRTRATHLLREVMRPR